MGRRAWIAGSLTLIALAAGPAVASAATCGLPPQAEPDFTNTALDVEGDIGASRTGGYLQIPFDVPDGTTAIRIRYSFDQPGDICERPPSPAPANTLDLGVYSPRDSGEAIWGIDESRGWSGSAVRDLAIAVNGFSDAATYDAAPRALVHGRTTRAYRPGPLPPGQWAVELGLAYIVSPDPNGIHYRVLVETTTSPDWADDPYSPSGYSGGSVRSAAGWYAGDLHLHGEQEPGNATMSDTLDLAFEPQASGGAGLDFVTLVDHNNDVARDDLAPHQAAHPDSLIIPGTEVTTYRGHYNNQGSGPAVDFRSGPILAPGAGTDLSADVPDSALVRTRDPQPPSGRFAELAAGGNWAQINHPTLFRELPAFCRGCAWSYDDAETDLSRVDAIEIQTGPAAVPAGSPSSPNPYTTSAIDFYEDALATGAHVAAVGVSDDHRAGSGTGPFDSTVGRATTMVYAEELSEEAITEGVRRGRTYVKLFGSDGPDVEFTALASGEPMAMIGDSTAASEATLRAIVTGAATTGRAGDLSVVLLRDGVAVETVPFEGDSFTREFAAEIAGRYSLEVVRSHLGQDYVELYTSPIYIGGGGVAGKPSNRFRVVRVKRNERRGTAKLTVKLPGAGEMVLSGKRLRRVKRTPEGVGKVKLLVAARSRGVIRELRADGEARVSPRLRFRPDGGDPRTKRKRVALKLRGRG